jgi:hypothetical protein
MESLGNWVDFPAHKTGGKVQIIHDLSAEKSSGIAGNYLSFFLRDKLN